MTILGLMSHMDEKNFAEQTSDWLHIVLLQPKIAGNLGSIVRLAANLRFTLHVVGPTPFESGKNRALWRAGLDYWAQANVYFHSSFDGTAESIGITGREGSAPYAVEVCGEKTIYDQDFSHGSTLIFGPEDGSVSDDIIQKVGEERTLSLPKGSGARCINLAQCVAVCSYELWRQNFTNT